MSSFSMVMVKFGNIRSTITPIVILATAVSLLISFATTPAIAQPTTGTPSPPTGPSDGTTTAPPTGPSDGTTTAPPTGPGDGTTTPGGGGDFAEFMQCLNAAGPNPSEADVTACYEPIYGTAGGDEEAADEGDGGEGEGDGGEGEGDGGEGTT
jgi:hypothetical protein